jgi:hypothetical protein
MAGANAGFVIQAVAMPEVAIPEIIIREIKSSTAGGNVRTALCGL